MHLLYSVHARYAEARLSQVIRQGTFWFTSLLWYSWPEMVPNQRRTMHYNCSRIDTCEIVWLSSLKPYFAFGEEHRIQIHRPWFHVVFSCAFFLVRSFDIDIQHMPIKRPKRTIDDGWTKRVQSWNRVCVALLLSSFHPFELLYIGKWERGADRTHAIRNVNKIFILLLLVQFHVPSRKKCSLHSDSVFPKKAESMHCTSTEVYRKSRTTDRGRPTNKRKTGKRNETGANRNQTNTPNISIVLFDIVYIFSVCNL